MSVCVCDRRQAQSLNQLIDLVQIRYLGSSCKYLEPLFPPKVKGSSYKKVNVLKNGSNDFDQIVGL